MHNVILTKKYIHENIFKKINLSVLASFFNCFVSKQRLKDTCSLFFEMFYFDGLLGCLFENRSYAGFAEATNAGFKSFKPPKSLQDKIFGT